MAEKREQNKLNQARLFITNNHFDEAYALLKEVIGENPKNESAFNLLGAICEKSGDIEGACFMYRVALRINPAHVPSEANLHRLAQVPPVLTGLNMGD